MFFFFFIKGSQYSFFCGAFSNSILPVCLMGMGVKTTPASYWNYIGKVWKNDVSWT